MEGPYKIAFDARPAQGKSMGITTYSLNLIKHFSSLSGDFNFVFIVDSNLDCSQIEFPSNSQFIYTTFGRGGNLKNWLTRDFFDQVLLPRKLIQKGVHLFHQPDFTIPIRKTPFVVVSSYLDAIAFTKDDDRNFFARARVKALLRIGARTADAIVTISDYSKQELVKYLGIKSSKINVVWCGISEVFFSHTKDEIIENCFTKLGFNSNFLLYFGGFGKRKNVNLLLEAFKLVHKTDNIKLVLVGRIDKETELNIRNLDLDKDIKTFGFGQEEELKVLLKQCSLFVFPSSMEGFGLPVAEAMACGAPIVCSTNGSLPEIAGSAVQYFESNEPKSLANAILKVIGDQNLREYLKSQSLIRAREFRWEKAVSELGKMYLELIGKKFPL